MRYQRNRRKKCVGFYGDHNLLTFDNGIIVNNDFNTNVKRNMSLTNMLNNNLNNKKVDKQVDNKVEPLPAVDTKIDMSEFHKQNEIGLQKAYDSPQYLYQDKDTLFLGVLRQRKTSGVT